MTNLFSVLDPTSSFLSNWLKILTPLLFIVMAFWLVPSRSQFLTRGVLNGLNREISLLIGPNRLGANILVIAQHSSNRSFFILFNNFLLLIYLYFTATKHLAITLRLAVLLWVSFIIYAWVMETLNALAHLIPLGTPVPLIPFILLIKIIRNFIWPMLSLHDLRPTWLQVIFF
jgi:hypothetical protein